VSEDFRSVASGLKRSCFCCHGTGRRIRFALKARFNTGDALSIPKKLVFRVNRAFISYNTARKIAGGLLSFHSGRA
jgi:hypothetical protein